MSAGGERKFPRQGTLVLGLLSMVLVGALSATTHHQKSPTTTVNSARARPTLSSTTVDVRQRLSRCVLRRQLHALASGSRASYLATWSARSSAAQRAAAVFANLRVLDATVSATRLRSASQAIPDGVRRRHLRHAWTADVEVVWHLGALEQRAVRSYLTYTFVRRGNAAVVVGIAASRGHPEPIWLLPDLHVRRSGHTLAVASSPRRATGLDVQLRRARQTLTRVLYSWHGSLIGFAPATENSFQALLGVSGGAYSAVAGVTSPMDSSGRPDAPIAIYLNPGQFWRLNPLGAQVVVTHEATHAATGAVGPDLPLWVVEGFADYVALRAEHVPASLFARALIREIRARGVPAMLPVNSAFARSGGRPEVFYEQSELAARLIARTYGPSRLLTFYRSVLSSGSAKEALRTVLGTTERSFTRDWRRSLKALASVR